MRLYHRVMSTKVADGMANSVDPDQTAPLGDKGSSRSSLIRVYTVCPGLSVRKLRIIRVRTLFLGRLRPPQRLTGTKCTHGWERMAIEILHDQSP